MATSQTFVDALRAVDARRSGGLLSLSGYRVSTREWLGGCVLDHLGLDVGDLLDGVSVIVTRDREVRNAVCDALRLVYRNVVHSFLADVPHDGGLVILEPTIAPDDYDDAVNVGAPVVIVVEGVDQVRPPGTRGTADRSRQVEVPLMGDVVSDLVTAVTGVDTHVPDSLAVSMSPVEVLRCVHLGSTADMCLDRMDVLIRGRGQGDALPEPAKPAAPAPQSGDVVRKLSEMSGFGAAQEWGVRLAKDLAAYAKGTLPWRDVDRGLLLSGPPGGGKTTFARALALECEVDLVTTTYNEWSAMGGTGDSMSKGMTKLFDTWRKKSESGPFILFVDEIDSMGPRGGAAHNESWFAPLINSWLAFLDGAVSRDGIVIVAATNHPERVDAGMLRPGRLDRHIELPMPDVAALAGIVRAHLGEDAVLDDADLAEAARAVRGRSPAQVSQLCREARRVARWCGRRVCASDLTDVLDGQRRLEGAADRRLVCVHEAGHAVAGAVLHGDTLVSVDADAGVTLFRSVTYASPRVIGARLTMMLSARAAEEVLLGEVTTGAQQDLKDATAVATAMHGAWGMGSYGLVHVPPEVAARDAAMVRAVRTTLDEAYARALDLVREYRPAIERVAEALAARRYLDAAEVRALVHPPEPKGTIRRIRAVAPPRP